MPQPSPETTHATTTPSPDGGGLAVVEAPTAEAALKEVQRRHGAGARIVHAEKVLRGGLGGFFQRELVQLTVDVDSGAVAASSRPVRTEDVHDATVGQRFLAAVREAMVADEADGTTPPRETFRELLDRAVGPQRPDGSLVADDGRGARRDLPGRAAPPARARFSAPAPDPATASPTQPAVPDLHAPWRPRSDGAAAVAAPVAPAAAARRSEPDEVVRGLDAVIARLSEDEQRREADGAAVLRSRTGATAVTDPAGSGAGATAVDDPADGHGEARAAAVADTAAAGDWRSRAVAGAPPAWVERLPRAEAASLRPVPPDPVRPSRALAAVTAEAWHGGDVDQTPDEAWRPTGPLSLDDRLATIAALHDADEAAAWTAHVDPADHVAPPAVPDTTAAPGTAARPASIVTTAWAPASVASAPAASDPGTHVPHPAARTTPQAHDVAPDPAATTTAADAEQAPTSVRDESTPAPAAEPVAVHAEPPRAARPARPGAHAARHRIGAPGQGRVAGRPPALVDTDACRRMQGRLADARSLARTPVGPAGPWSLDGLRRLGVPAAVVDLVGDAHPVDDLGWFTALATAVAGVCTPLPAGDRALVGPAAQELADLTGDRVGTQAGAHGTQAPWLELVVGGPGWRDGLWEPGVAALSVVRGDALPEALGAAVDLGLPLARAVVGDRVVRLSAVDVAAALRGLLEARA